MNRLFFGNGPIIPFALVEYKHMYVNKIDVRTHENFGEIFMITSSLFSIDSAPECIGIVQVVNLREWKCRREVASILLFNNVVTR